MFAALLLVLVAWAEPGGSIGRIEDFAGWLRDHDDNEGKLVLTLAALVVALLMATVMLVELTPAPTQKMRVRNVQSGDAVVTTKQIAERIEAEARAVPHVADCNALVAARGNRVDVVLDLHVDAGADLARAADEACRRAHTLVEEKMGMALPGRPRAKLHYRELRLGNEPAQAAVKSPEPRDAPSPQRPSTGWERPAEEERT